VHLRFHHYIFIWRSLRPGVALRRARQQTAIRVEKIVRGRLERRAFVITPIIRLSAKNCLYSLGSRQANACPPSQVRHDDYPIGTLKN
jgi:hypothetical protein